LFDARSGFYKETDNYNKRLGGSTTRDNLTKFLIRAGEGQVDLSNSTENRVISANAGTNLIVLLLGVAHVIEVSSGGQHGSTEPNGETLHVVGDNLNLKRGRLDLTARELLRAKRTLVNNTLNVTVQTATEVLEHGGSSGENDVLVETTTNVNGARLDNLINDLREGSQEIIGEHLGVEEDLGTQETLVANINLVGLLGDLVLLLEDLEVRASLIITTFLSTSAGGGSGGLLEASGGRTHLLNTRSGSRSLSHGSGSLGRGRNSAINDTVVLVELLQDIRANIRELLLDTLGNLERLSGRDGLIALTKQVLNESSDITTSERDVLDRGADNVTLSNRDNVGNTITRVDNGTSQGALGLL
jgi:hypothetical protein